MTALRSLVFNISFYLVLIVIMIGGLPLFFAGPQQVKGMARLWSEVSLVLLRVICGLRVEVRGLENLPEGGFILASKHQSFLDILALIPLVPRFIFVLKRELMRIPLFGHYLARSGMIAVDRAKGRAVMGDLNGRVRAAVQGGQQLIIFPEGTRRTPGAEPSYKAGVSHLYAACGVPCVPVALNTGLFWPRRRFLRRPGVAVIDILPAIPPGLDRATAAAELQRRIEAASDALLLTARAGAADMSAAVSG